MWRECPSDGPIRSAMHHPNKPTLWRYRTCFGWKDRLVRTCSLIAGVEGGFCAALGRRAMQREWHLKRLTKRQRPSDIDLKYLDGIPLEGLGTIHWNEKLRRFVLPDVGTIRIGHWYGKAMLHRYGLVEDVSDALYGAANPWSMKTRESVLVPVDLRFGLDEQFSSLRKTLATAQRFVLRLVGRDRPYQVSSDIMWRDIYCYLEHTEANKPYKQIAREVFPKEVATPSALSKTAKKVRTIVSRVRRAMKDAK